MTTIRQQLIGYAALIIVDSGNPDLTTERIDGALNGAAEHRPSFVAYHESVPLGGRAEKLLITAVREAALKHPRLLKGRGTVANLTAGVRTAIADLADGGQLHLYGSPYSSYILDNRRKGIYRHVRASTFNQLRAGEHIVYVPFTRNSEGHPIQDHWVLNSLKYTQHGEAKRG